MRDDDFSILGVAASGDECAAMVRRRDGRRRRYVVVLIVLANVVAPLLGSVHGDNVPEIHFYAARRDAIRDALQFVAIFLIDARPHNVFGGVTEKIPVLAIVVREFELVDVFEVGDFRGEKIAVLVADLRGRALHVDEGPSADGGLPKRALQAIIQRGSGSAVRDRNGGYDRCDQERGQCNASTHLRLQIEERNYRVRREFTRRVRQVSTKSTAKSGYATAVQ